jgi:hypothetical protein
VIVRDFVCLQNLVPQANAECRPFLKAMPNEAEHPTICKPALNVTRALRDKLLICAYRLFKLGNPFKARIVLNGENALRWN